MKLNHKFFKKNFKCRCYILIVFILTFIVKIKNKKGIKNRNFNLLTKKKFETNVQNQDLKTGNLKIQIDEKDKIKYDFYCNMKYSENNNKSSQFILSEKIGNLKSNFENSSQINPNYKHDISLFKSQIVQTYNNFNCDINPKYKALHILTNSHENSDEFNVDILKDCEIQEMWKTQKNILRSCESPKRAIEGEDNIRRAFRFAYLPNLNQNVTLNETESIIIEKITLEFPKNVAESSLTKNKLILHPGDFTDIYLNYDCNNFEGGLLKFKDNWYKIKFILNFAGGDVQFFEFIKVCNASYIDSVDLSHFIILCFIFLVAYLSTKEYLKSKFEKIIVEKYTEMRNPENISLISLVVLFILIFFGVVNFFETWVSIVIIIFGPISIAMISEALLKYNNILTNLECRSYELPIIGSISFLFSLCLIFGFFIQMLFIYSQNWLLNNLIAISISLIIIRLFKLTNFKLIFIIFNLRFFYDLIWCINNSQYFTENFKLSNASFNNFPIKFLCPEFSQTPFNSCNFLPIADIILPGILITYSKIFDENKGIKIYFLSSNIGLAIGLFLTMIVYYVYKLPLPSFLFSGPLMIISILLVAYKIGHLQKFIEGFSSTLLESNMDNNARNQYLHHSVKADYIPPEN